MDIKKLIGDNKLKQAFEAISAILKGLNDTELYNTYINLSSRYSTLLINSNLGILSNSEQTLEKNRIVIGLLALVDKLGDIDYQDTSFTNNNIKMEEKLNPRQFTSQPFLQNTESMNRILQFGKQLVIYFRGKLSSADFKQFCGKLDDAVDTLNDRLVWNRASELLEQIKNITAEYEEIESINSTETTLQELYNNAKEVMTYDSATKLLTAIMKKYPANTTLNDVSTQYDSEKADSVNRQNRVQGPISKRTIETEFVKRWLSLLNSYV